MDRWIDIVNALYMYTMDYQWAIKKWNLAICDNISGPRGYYAKWNKSDRERQIPNYFSNTWNVKNKTNKHNKTETDS